MNDTPIKSISAVKPKREGGHARAKKRQGGHNVIWKRITKSYDEDLRKFGANPAMVAPLSRWALFNHLTPTQAQAGRLYAAIVRAFERYCLPAASRSARSANLEPVRKANDDELERIIANAALPEYEHDAKRAKSQYRRLMRVLEKYADPITGRNLAKDHLDTLCLADQEPPPEVRKDIAVVLSAIAKEFGIGVRKRKIAGYRA